MSDYFNNVPKNIYIWVLFHTGFGVMSVKNIVDANHSTFLSANGSTGMVSAVHPDTGVPTRIEFQNPSHTFYTDRNETSQQVVRTLIRGTISTIHRFQGSEADTVIAAFAGNDTEHLTTLLLYTGCSRARKRLVLIMKKKTLEYLGNLRKHRTVSFMI